MNVHAGALVVATVLPLFAGCTRQTAVERVEWTVMGTVAAVQFRGDVDKSAVAEVKRVFADVERFLNAHDPASEINRIAGLPDRMVLTACDPLVRPCYEAAFAFRRETGGAFDPRWRGEKTLDLGAIAKGFAVDLAARKVADAAGGRDMLIDLGGNLKAVSGKWNTAIAMTGRAIKLGPGEACATSAGYYRGDHIRDGRTGKPVAADGFSVTVIHPSSAMCADALSTSMFILGERKGMAYLDRVHPGAKAVFAPLSR